MFAPRIKIDRDLYEKVKAGAARAGYASVDEFVRHALEQQLRHLETPATLDQVRQRLQGLGYLS